MNTPLIIWLCIAIFAVLIVTVRAIDALLRNNRLHHHLIEIATEREEFFVPGDPTDNDEIYDDND